VLDVRFKGFLKNRFGENTRSNCFYFLFFKHLSSLDHKVAFEAYEFQQIFRSSSHFRGAVRQKIEKFPIPNSVMRRDCLAQKTRRSAIPRPKIACVHGP
jgi:hypothetical protein